MEWETPLLGICYQQMSFLCSIYHNLWGVSSITTNYFFLYNFMISYIKTVKNIKWKEEVEGAT